MLSFRYDDGILVEVSAEYLSGAVDRNDMKTPADAERIAREAYRLTGRWYLPVDAGEWTSPRYDVIEAPTVGAEVSKGFNGDYYPCGKIVSVSATFKKVTTDQGMSFYRRGQSATWLEGGIWVMVSGRKSELNPSF